MTLLINENLRLPVSPAFCCQGCSETLIATDKLRDVRFRTPTHSDAGVTVGLREQDGEK